MEDVLKRSIRLLLQRGRDHLGTSATKKNRKIWEFFPSRRPPLPPVWEPHVCEKYLWFILHCRTLGKGSCVKKDFFEITSYNGDPPPPSPFYEVLFFSSISWACRWQQHLKRLYISLYKVGTFLIGWQMLGSLRDPSLSLGKLTSSPSPKFEDCINPIHLKSWEI